MWPPTPRQSAKMIHSCIIVTTGHASGEAIGEAGSGSPNEAPRSKLGVSQNSILKTSRNSEDLSEAEVNPVASCEESQVEDGSVTSPASWLTQCRLL